MDSNTIGLITTIILAFCGYFAAYLSKKIEDKRNSRLALINKQIELFYGPLYIATKAGELEIQLLRKKFNKAKISHNLTEKELSEWRIWCKNIFVEHDIKKEKIIMEHSSLILEDEMPKCLIELQAYLSEFKILVTKWDNGDYSENFTVSNYPKDLGEYTAKSYKFLKKEQARLIGKTSNMK